MNNDIKLKRNKQEVLIGSSRLSTSDIAVYDRDIYMAENMSFNKAYKFAEISSNIDSNELLYEFKNKYKDYRKRWREQPKECINSLNFGSRLLESGK